MKKQHLQQYHRSRHQGEAFGIGEQASEPVSVQRDVVRRDNYTVAVLLHVDGIVDLFCSVCFGVGILARKVELAWLQQVHLTRDNNAIEIKLQASKAGPVRRFPCMFD